MICPICNSADNSKFIDNYKLHIEYDKEYFKNLKIYSCSSCDFSFCHPMPDRKLIDNFYRNIYRSSGRPHQIFDFSLNELLYSGRNKNYIQYLTTFLNINELETVFDFGSGTGDLGFLLSKLNKKINLYCEENDNFSKKILTNRGYTNLINSKEKISTDLIISLHTLEHLSDITVFERLKDIAKPESYIFLEVPNCEFDGKFIDRPYDSPHLLFFTKKSFKRIAKKYGFEIIDIALNGMSINDLFFEMKESKKRFYNWRPNQFSLKLYLKELIRFFTPDFIMKIYKYYNAKESNLNDYRLNFNDAWCVRVIFKVHK